MDALPEASPPVTRRAQWGVVAAMLISTFMAAAEITVISTAMPTIVARLGGFELFAWAFGVYLLGQAVTTPIYGRLADLFGRRRVFLGSLACFLAGSLLCGLAWSMPSLIAFRAIQGLGGGGLIPLATIIISDVTAPAQRPRMLSYVSLIWGAAAIGGPLLGSLCVSTLGWPFVFWINLPVGGLTAVLVMRFLRDPVRPAPAGGVDWPGTALLGSGIAAGMAALIQWQALSPAWRAGLLVACAACLAGFSVRERRLPEPMLATGLLRRPVILAANLTTFLTGSLLIANTAFVPSWVQGVAGGTPVMAGAVIGVLTISWTSASVSLGRVLAQLDTRSVAFASAAAVAVGSAGFLGLAGGLPVLLVASAVLGAGLGMSSLVFTVAVQSGVGYAERGRATSLYYFCRLIGQAVGSAAFGGVLNAGLRGAGGGTLDRLMDPATRAALSPAALAPLVSVLAAALHGVFGLALLLAMLTLPAALLIPRARQPNPAPAS